MRPRFRFVVPALLLSSVLAQAADEIGWVRFDGAPGWVAAAPANVPPSGAAPIPLFAPTWFLKFPDAKVELVPEGTYDLASARGSVLLVDYWAS